MVVIELHNRRYDVQSREIVVEPAARIEVDGSQLTVTDGDSGWSLIREIVLNHPETKGDLTFESDPELWALTLPEAFRTGDTSIEVQRVEPQIVAPVSVRAVA